MGTTAEKLAYLSETKTAIKDAIVAKGVEVPKGTTFRGYAERIGAIETWVSGEALITISTPSGRLAGDVDGDGSITAIDLAKMREDYYAGLDFSQLTDYEKKIYDVNQNGTFNIQDIGLLGNVIRGSVKYASLLIDADENWIQNPNYSTERAQYYADIAVDGLKSTSDLSLYVESSEDAIDRAKFVSDGILRVYTVRPPINGSTYSASISDGTGVISIKRAENFIDLFEGVISSNSAVDVNFSKAYGQYVIYYSLSPDNALTSFNLTSHSAAFLFPTGQSSNSTFVDSAGSTLKISELGYSEQKNAIRLEFTNKSGVDQYLSYRVYATNYNMREILFYGG